MENFTLPDSTKMENILNEWEESDYIKEKLFPLLLKYAGTKNNAFGIRMMIDLAIADANLPRSSKMVLIENKEELIKKLTPNQEAYKACYEKISANLLKPF